MIALPSNTDLASTFAVEAARFSRFIGRGVRAGIRVRAWVSLRKSAGVQREIDALKTLGESAP